MATDWAKAAHDQISELRRTMSNEIERVQSSIEGMVETRLKDLSDMLNDGLDDLDQTMPEE